MKIALTVLLALYMALSFWLAWDKDGRQLFGIGLGLVALSILWSTP